MNLRLQNVRVPQTQSTQSLSCINLNVCGEEEKILWRLEAIAEALALLGMHTGLQSDVFQRFNFARF